MAIISCPQCQKNISDKATRCEYCDVSLANQDAESAAIQGRINRIKVAQSLQTQTFIALMLFVGGFSLWYWENAFDEQWYNKLGQGMIAVGFIWYIINRLRTMLNKRKK